MNQRFVVGKKQNALIAHRCTPEVEAYYNRVELENGNILVLPTRWPFPVAPMRPE